MKVFFSKLKKANLIMKIFYFLSLILYWVAYGFFARSLLSLVGIETVSRVIVLIIAAIFGIVYTIFGLVKMFQNKKVGFIILTIFTLLFAGVLGFGSYFIDKIYNKIENFTAKETSTYTTAIVTLSATEFSSESKIGMITDEEDRTGYILPMEMIVKENINNIIEYYDNTTELLNALYAGEVDAIFINKDYVTLYSSDEKYTNIGSETKIVKEYSKEMKTEESELLVSTKSLTEPFTVLVMGVDSESKNGLDANAAFNGDTLILITFNPKTLSATMFSIPRDLYVPIYNSSGRNVGLNKINSSAAYGTASTVNTIENLTDIEIDYFVKVNFQGVIDLVNALGGIDVDVEPPNYSAYINKYGEGRLCESGADRTYTNMVCMNTGWQHLNGEQALAYARNRHGYLESDIARNRHQQQIIEAIAKKLVQTSSFSDFENLLDTISNNIATNMQTSQILSFYQSLKGMLMRALNGDNFIEIKKMQLSYFSFNNIYRLSCLGYYQGSLDAITNAMKENLEIIQAETIKTFSYDYSVDYEQDSEIIGKGIYSGGKVPDSSVTDPVIPTAPENDPDNQPENPDDSGDSTNEDPGDDSNEEDPSDNEDPDVPGTPEEPTDGSEGSDGSDSSEEGNNEDKPEKPDEGDENTDPTPGEPTI